jgi:hypothetical protein
MYEKWKRRVGLCSTGLSQPIRISSSAITNRGTVRPTSDAAESALTSAPGFLCSTAHFRIPPEDVPSVPDENSKSLLLNEEEEEEDSPDLVDDAVPDVNYYIFLQK